MQVVETVLADFLPAAVSQDHRQLGTVFGPAVEDIEAEVEVLGNGELVARGRLLVVAHVRTVQVHRQVVVAVRGHLHDSPLSH